MRKKIICVGQVSLLCFLTVIAAQKHELLIPIEKKFLSNLISVDALLKDARFDAAYILGGDQTSLKAKYMAMSKIYKQGNCNTIIILSRSGLTEYNPSLGRNLANNEWSLMFLDKLGIPRKDVEVIKIQSGFFGTYSEAKSISKEVEQRKWNSILLVTSIHHTKRARKTFEYFMDDTKTNLSVIAAEHKISFFEVLSEFFKVKFYQFFLLC